MFTPEKSIDELLNALEQPYFTDTQKEILRTDLVAEVASGLGYYFAGQEEDSKPYLVTSAQMRRFYNDAKALEDRIKNEGKTFETYHAEIAMIKAKAAYARREGGGRDKAVPKQFEQFLETCANLIQERKDFDGFMQVFESVVGYYYGFGGGRR